MEAAARKLVSTFENKVFINGAWVETGTYQLTNPVTGKLDVTAPQATPADAGAACEAAKAAYKTWSKLPHGERAEWLRKLADALEARKDEIAAVEALNCGKPFREAQGDVDDAVGAFRYCARQAEAIPTRYIQPVEALPDPSHSGSIHYVPVGVVAAICPFNFPLMMAAWKVGPSLAAGCTIVVKPSEYTPLTALCLASVAESIGLPAGVINIVTGDGAVGSVLTSHPAVDKISFTGSVPTGSKVMKAAADGIKRVTLELGGKSPAIVFPDADLDAAMEWLFFGFAWNAGQICSATTRLLLHEDIAEEVVARLAAAARAVKVGGPFDEGVECGPINNRMQYEKVLRYLAIAKEEGYGVACGGGPAPGAPEGGFYIAPTVFTGVRPHHTLFKEEVFGPVAVVTTFKTEEEAVALANDSEFGLAAAVFSTDLDKAERVAGELRAGTVWINNAQPSPHAMAWGGFGKSGIGREMGPFALLPFLEQRSVTRYAPPGPVGWYRPEMFAKPAAAGGAAAGH